MADSSTDGVYIDLQKPAPTLIFAALLAIPSLTIRKLYLRHKHPCSSVSLLLLLP